MPTMTVLDSNSSPVSVNIPNADGRALVATSRSVCIATEDLVSLTTTGTRAYNYATGQRITTSGAGQVRSTAITGTEILLHASIRGFIRIGDVSVVATVGAGSIPLEAGEKFHLRITTGQFVSWIRDGAVDGSLSIVPAV